MNTVCERAKCVCVKETEKHFMCVCVCFCVNKYCEKGSGLNPKGRAERHTCLNISMLAMGLCAWIIPLFVERIPAGLTLPRFTGGLSINI